MRELLKFAREVIDGQFQNKMIEPSEKIKEKYGKYGACFVTLTKHDVLRGCIGSLEAVRPLWKDIQMNAISSAFYDSRFKPLTEDELDFILIEISVLTKPRRMWVNNSEELLSRLNNKLGLILKKGPYSATFLPQVWEQIPDKIKFLEELSIKAGLHRDSWKDSQIWFYSVKSVKEKEKKPKHRKKNLKVKGLEKAK